ncbi:MAG: VWA domain-containing protein [Vicinamibacterales bacterium]
MPVPGRLAHRLRAGCHAICVICAIRGLRAICGVPTLRAICVICGFPAIRAICGLGAICGLLAIGGPVTALAQADAQLRFNARTELVLVDVSVTDGQSNPVTDLTVADFDLEVNGQTRPIASAQFVSTVTDAPAAPAAADQPSTNDAPTSGRLLLFVVDDGHIRVGGAQAIVRTSEMLLDQLAPGDMVGVARLPTGIGSVEFTADRARVRDALRRPAGNSTGPMGSTQVQISEAFALENGDRDTWQRAVERECGGTTDLGREACADALEADGRNALSEASARAAQTVRYLDVLFERLARLNTPVHVVMISEGLFVGRAPTSLLDLSRRAAEARVTLHIVRPARSLMADASRAVAPGQSFSMDDYLLRDGLEQLAGQTRGRLIEISAGNGSGAFQRLTRELSGYYLIGFEPTDADRTGRQRRIKLQVRRRGLTVRARPTFALARDVTPPSAAAATTDSNRTAEDVVRDLLSSPLPDRGIPIQVATFNTTDPGDPRVRVIISAAIGAPATEPAEWPLGVLVLDSHDKAAAGHVARMILAPATPRAPSPRLLQTTVLLEPGEYTLRLAVADDEGHTGSVHHTIRAGLTPMPGRQEITDLLVASEPLPPDPARLLPAPRVDTESVSFQLSVSGQNNAQLANTSVTIQVAESESAPPLTSVVLPLARREATLRTFGGLLRLGLIPPGDYVARALVAAPGQPETRVTRRFHYEPSLAPPPERTAERTPATPVSVDDEVLPPPPPRIAVRLPTFDPATVLARPVVDAFLASLEGLYPPSPDAERVLARAHEGRYDAPEPGRGGSAEDETVFAFVRGLSELEKKRYPQATAWFQVALKAGSEFLGSAFYIGACHAALGHDQEAVGAWQMSLLSDAADVVYPPLVDGLLRMGDGLQALTFLDEAPDAWDDTTAREERQATAEAMTGAYVPALERLHALIEQRPDDMDLTFLALQVMYRIRQETGALGGADRERFALYAARYTEQKGPQAPLVATWLRFVVAR